jgi:dienelactone hydrolase
MTLADDFWVQPAELTLAFRYPQPARRLSFGQWTNNSAEWRAAATAKLGELLHLDPVEPCDVHSLRRTHVGNVTIDALCMQVSADLSIPAYYLTPDSPVDSANLVMAIHGHGEAQLAVGAWDDYHHRFALRLAEAGHCVLCPELRGFGALRNLAAGLPGHRLDYWNWGQHMAYSLVTDSFQHGHTLLGDTVGDLLRWEQWAIDQQHKTRVHVAGISYGGDLALTYPIFSPHVVSIFASGTLGSFEPIFARCYNAPAHCIPGILNWLDRADIAGLNAPRPLAIHYGALDTPGDGNYSASYNETVEPSLRDLRQIYAAFGAPDAVQLHVSPETRHEMDIPALLAFLAQHVQP